MNNASWTLYSIIHNLDLPVRLRMVVDGNLSPERQRQVEALFPGITLSHTRDHLAAVGGTVPGLTKLARTHPMAGKMAAILELQRRGHLLFTDDDVLAFRTLQEINFEMADGVRRVRYLREHAAGAVQEEPSVKAGLQALGLEWLRDINVGFMLIPQGSLDEQLCRRILAAAPEVKTWFPDTMLLAGLLAQVASQVLPDSYVVSTQRQFIFEVDVDCSRIVLRHFVGPVRHLMYLRGMPQLLRQWRQRSGLSSGAADPSYT